MSGTLPLAGTLRKEHTHTHKCQDVKVLNLDINCKNQCLVWSEQWFLSVDSDKQNHLGKY